MFTPETRERVRHALVERASSDPRITGAALTGSAARGDEDRWSDVDLFLAVDITAPLEETLVARLEGEELHRALRAVTWCLVTEVRRHQPELAERLEVPLSEVAAG